MGKPSSSDPNAMWGGHYTLGPAQVMAEINASIHVDKLLYSQDIDGSQAHCRMLAKQGILTQAEADSILGGLQEVRAEIERGEMEFMTALEDIHMHVEARLKELIGDTAGKLHTARSRNDQVATDFRLWVRDALDSMDNALARLQATLLQRAEEHADTIMPGFTHLQFAQPITLGHHLMAYVHMFGRDRGRMADARRRLNECPLGAAALAGTSFPIDRTQTAKDLGFDRPMPNSLDAVASRDFALEYLAASSICIQHLSKLAEEFIIWSNPAMGFVKFSEAFTTGSSIMPQKRNPDGAELIRGKTGRIYGALINLLTVTKGLPLAYNKDLQEDKEPVFDVTANLQLSIFVMAGMVADFTANKERMRDVAGSGYATATDLADWLVRTLGIPFREAHHITGRIVREAESRGCTLAELDLTTMQSVHSGITQNVFSVLTVEASVASRTSLGGTAPAAVREAIRAARTRYLSEGA